VPPTHDWSINLPYPGLKSVVSNLATLVDNNKKIRMYNYTHLTTKDNA
jgi:hypothetical protein